MERMPTVRDVIGYLCLLDPDTVVVRYEDDIDEPMEFVALAGIPLAQLDEAPSEAPPALASIVEELGERMNNDNFKRGDRAAAALSATGYEDPAVTITESTPTPSGARSPGTAYPISDLIADLCHLARRVGVSDLVELVEHGVAQYGGDCVEQAWENDEDFDNLLQTEDSVARALTILRIAGVPKRFDAKVLRMLGLGGTHD
jgi:hypothetical protein